MKFTEALAIVLDLAEQNAFSVQDCGNDRELIAESVRQERAIAEITAWAENKFGKEWR
jgi:hypothetical protein